MHVFWVSTVLAIFFEKFFRVSNRLVKDQAKHLGSSYLQRLSADDKRIAGKELTNMSVVSFLWDIDKPDATERVVSIIRVQTVWIQIRPD